MLCVNGKLDGQQLAVNLQRSVGLMGQDLLSQDLAQLHTFLVKAV